MTDERVDDIGPEERLHGRVWFVTLSLGLLGVAATAFGHARLGVWVYTAALLPLAAAAFRRLGTLETALGAVPAVGGWGLFLAAGLASTGLGDLSLERYVPLGMMASQLMLLGLTIDAGSRPSLRRTPVPLTGHLAVAAGASFVALSGTLLLGGLLLATLGFSLLLVEAFWAHPETRDARVESGWEDAFLLILAVSLLSVTLLVELSGRRGVAFERVGAIVLATLHALVLFGVAVLSLPDLRVREIEVLSGPIPEMLAEVTSFVFFLHAALLALVLVAAWVLEAVFWGLTVWLLVAVLLEYATVVHALRPTGSDPPDPDPVDEAITVVLAARNEADVLRETVPENLDLDLPLEFLLVPAASSTDGTVEVARRMAREHPERVEVVVGTGGSKAADLNQAWEHVRTDIVLILDADEVVEPENLRWGVARIRRQEGVGVVQGRKTGRGIPDGWIDRFIRVERRFSTRLDHPLQSDVFGAAHFAGSAALVRREVPPEVGGWDPAMLTEDIDFALRVASESDWRTVYEPRMTVWETDPRNIDELIRQRGRWARGWCQVAARHLPRLVRGRSRTTMRERLGWSWQIVTAVSAPWSVFLPVMTLFFFLGEVPILPVTLGVLLLAFILPSRGLAYLLAYFGDDVNPEPQSVWGGVRVLLLSYLWIVVGWLLQIQALYLEVSGAPRTWKPTRDAET